MRAEFLGRDEVAERDLFLLQLDASEDFPERIELSSPRFVCLIAWDARAASVDQIGNVARKLLDSGAVYVCAWGPDCQRVHDVIDEECAGPDLQAELEGVVMTTWHDEEPLSAAVEFALLRASPSDAFAAGCASILGVAIGSPAWAGEIREAFADPSRVLA